MKNCAMKQFKQEAGNINNLFVTWDNIGSTTGGGIVTFNELEALKKLGPTDVLNPPITQDPFESDLIALSDYKKLNKKYKFAHFYSSSYPEFIKELKKDGTKISYTIAAHDIKISKEEFEKFGLNYNFPHLTDPVLFEKYLSGYKLCDLIICPSEYSKDILISYGLDNIKVIPHGCNQPKEVKKINNSVFNVCYLGAIGPDKGLIYLLEAWAKLNYSDAQLVIGGKDSIGLFPLIRQISKGSIFLTGYIEDIKNFYNNCNLYVQPSASEGFGIEVFEAMSYARPVICSKGAGAASFISDNKKVNARNPIELANKIDYYKNNPEIVERESIENYEFAKKYYWENVRRMYCDTWRTLLK